MFRRCFVILAGIFCLSVGCSERSVAPAMPRTGGAPTVFHESVQTEAAQLPFLHRGLFAAISIDLDRLKRTEGLDKLPWEQITRPAIDSTGNTPLPQAQRIWILIDSEDFSSFLGLMAAGAEQPTPPLLVVYEAKEAWDRQVLWQSVKQIGNDGGELTINQRYELRNDPSSLLLLDESTLVTGPGNLVSRLQTTSANQVMIDHWTRTDSESAIRLFAQTSTIRSQIKPWFEMVSRMSPQSPWGALPDVLNEVSLAIDLEQPTFLQSRIVVEDENLRRELGQMIYQQLNEATNSGPATPLGDLMNAANGEAVYQWEAPQQFAKVFQQITQDQLISIRNEQQALMLEVQRPAELTELIAAVVRDVSQQLHFAERSQAAERIAEALKQYVNEYNDLPPRSEVRADNLDIDSQLSGLSWRVALLPQLGYADWHSQFRINEPWDSEHNLAIAKQIPARFPLADASGQSRWQLSFGDRALYQRGSVQSHWGELRDRKIWTSVLFESHPDQAAFWTNPNQPEIPPNIDLSQWGQPGEAGVLFINASFQGRMVRRSAEKMRALITIDGDERLTTSDFLLTTPRAGNRP